MKRSRSGRDLHIPSPFTPPFPPSRLPALGVAEANDGGVDWHTRSNTASIPSDSVSRDAQPGNFSTAASADGADLIGFTNPTSISKPVSESSSRLAPMSASVQAAEANLSACDGDLPAQLAVAKEHITGNEYVAWPCRSYGCSFCGREFNSAQALGGHMNIHRRDRARLRTSLENFPASTSPAAHYQAAKFASPFALPHHSLASISGNLADQYPVIMAPLRATNSASARVSPFVTDQKCPIYHSYYSQSPLTLPTVLYGYPPGDAAVASPLQLAPPSSDLPLQSSISISERSTRLMVAPTSMSNCTELAPGQGQGPTDSMSRTCAAWHTPYSSTVRFHEGERCALSSSQETSSSSAGTVDCSGLRTRDLNSLHIMQAETGTSPAVNYRQSSSNNVDLELRLGTQGSDSP